MEGIISDNDCSVTVEPKQEGLLVSAACPRCGRHRQVMHPWQELQALLQNRAVGGYQAVRGGWVVTVPCAQSCMTGNRQRSTISYRLSAKELREYMG